MKYYSQLLEMGCFTREQLTVLTGNHNTTGTLLKNYLKKGYIQKVKRNLYVAINLADGEPVVNKFRIAGHVTESAYVSHHAAFEYYGYANQVSYQVEVSTDTPFSSFDFNGNTFVCFASRIAEGITDRPDLVRVTDVERTVLDGIHDFEKVMGLEELLRCLEMIPSLNGDRLLRYLSCYKRQVLYQKTGFLLQNFGEELGLDNSFFNECLGHIGKSTRYLIHHNDNVYHAKWRLVAPKDIGSVTMKGVEPDADI